MARRPPGFPKGACRMAPSRSGRWVTRAPDRPIMASSSVRRLTKYCLINGNGPNSPWATRPPWFEVKNPLPSAVVLDGWSVRGRQAETTLQHTFPNGVVLGANGGLLAVWSDVLVRRAFGGGGASEPARCAGRSGGGYGLDRTDQSAGTKSSTVSNGGVRLPTDRSGG